MGADTEKFVLIADAGDIARAAELRRVKMLATLVLAGCVVVLVIAKTMERVHPGFGFLAAFAEAAAIGGLADWYAVVALFRRPLGLPIPHTAIIPQPAENRRETGRVHRAEFPRAAPVEAKLRSVDFASFVADWLSDRSEAASLRASSCGCCRKRWRRRRHRACAFSRQQVMARLQALDLAPIAAGTLQSFVREGRHRACSTISAAIHNSLTSRRCWRRPRENPRRVADHPAFLSR